MTEPSYKIIDVNVSNLNEYDLFCHKSKKKMEGYQNKVRWVKDRFKEGLRIKLLMVRERKGFTSRGFIEYIPGEYTWRGIDAKGYMVIHCIWVVGRNKGKGYGTKLLEHCLNDAKGMHGVAVVTTKKTWLPKDKLFVKHGFEKADTFSYFDLYVKRFSGTTPLPKFYHVSKEQLNRYKNGLTVFKSGQCPYESNMVKAVCDTAEQMNIPVQIEHIESGLDAQTGVHPYGTFCVLLNGKELTYHSESRKTIAQLLEKHR
ncbi:MAG: GNAT family N-acetyltransferase [Candidatus Heimdallarchaeota archaeon]